MRFPVESVAGGAAKQIVVSIFGELRSNCKHEFQVSPTMSWRALMTILSFLLVNPHALGRANRVISKSCFVWNPPHLRRVRATEVASFPHDLSMRNFRRPPFSTLIAEAIRDDFRRADCKTLSKRTALFHTDDS
jgi:hypothetical protein